MPSTDNFSIFFDSRSPRCRTDIGRIDVEVNAVPVDPERVQAIFLEAAELESAAGRAAVLDRQCGVDAELRQRVETLLRAHDAPGPFLESPAADPAETIDEPSITERPGTVIGPYKLLEQIGEGGFGVVFMAEQTQPVRRKVALKVLKPGMDTRQIVARFEAERQALAIMDHPNIAKVFDGGATPSRRPYFVMELVKGVPVTEYCDQNHLTPRQRLELFIPVCQAVQHAHQKGIIHRDLKPSNILVAMHDTTPVPKIIDLGVAKALGQELTDKTLCTGFTQMIGTPIYMSPEQAGQSGLDIDTRSDIYSLGVLLYELLTGTTPFTKGRFKKATYDEIRRIICEEEPPKPSTRLSQLSRPGEPVRTHGTRSARLGGPTSSLASISAQRHTEPAKLRRLMRGELDWIVMKALEKDRNRRYETANSFATDLQRYLSDEPVHACPPTVGYRLRKLLRRHRGPVFAASLMMLMLLGGIIGTTWGMIRATDAEAGAVSEANQKTDALKDREAALTDAKEQLFHALVQQARAERSSDRVGQRFEALKAIREAAKMRVTPELRTEAIAALVLPDAEIVQEWEAWPEGSLHIAFDGNYRRYVRMDQQGGIVVCQLRDGREDIIARLPTQAKPPFGGVSISPDGRYVAYGERQMAGTGAANVLVWKVEGPTPVLLVEVPEGMSEGALVFRGNGRQLAIGHADGSVDIYDLATGKRVQRLAVGAPPRYLAFHPGGDGLAVACGHAVKLFDVGTARELSVLRHTDTSSVRSVAWHPDGRRLATSCNDRKIRLWDAETATELMFPWEAPFATGYDIVFNHAGDRLASCGWDATTLVWDVASGRLLLIIPGLLAHFSTDDGIVGYRSSGNNIQLLQLTNGRELRLLRSRKSGNLGSIDSPIVDANGRLLAASGGHWLSFFDLANGEELASVRLLRPDAACPVFFDPPPPAICPDRSGKGEELGGWMTGGHSALFLWPARSEPARPGTVCVGPPRQIAPDGGAGYSTGASASADGRVVAVPQGNSTLVLHRDQPERHLSLGPQHDVRFAAVSPNGRWVATCSWWWDGRSKTGLIWDAETGKRVHDLLQGASASAKFSPDGRWLMTTSGNDSHLWEAGTWRQVRRFDRVHFCFSPNSRLLAMNDVISVIRLLETSTGREVARLTGPDSVWYQPACFTPDGTRLVTTSPGNTGLYVWDLRLIRTQLKELGLDWEWPEFPAQDSGGEGAKPLKVEVQLGDFGNPTLTREQRARQAIERYRRSVAKRPDDARACNCLAWIYATAPEPLRDVRAAVPLAENAVKLAPKIAMYVNTLGVAYYRAGRYREAVELLRANLANQEDWGLAFDLYFLAMSHQRLGETARARDYYDWAVRWTRTQQGLSEDHLEELTEFRAEARELLGIKEK
jgi:serine/threonine protein kinase/WD40 repeat protein